MSSLCGSLRSLIRPTASRRRSASTSRSRRASFDQGEEKQEAARESTSSSKAGRRPFLHLQLDAGGLAMTLGPQAEVERVDRAAEFVDEGEGRGTSGSAGRSAMLFTTLQDSPTSPVAPTTAFPRLGTLDLAPTSAVEGIPVPESAQAHGSPPPLSAIYTRQPLESPPSSPPSSPSQPQPQRRPSASSSASITYSLSFTTPPSSPRSRTGSISFTRPPSPLARRISTRLDAEGRRVLARARGGGSGSGVERTRRVKKSWGVGDGESSSDEEAEGGRWQTRSASESALNLGGGGRAAEWEDDGEEGEDDFDTTPSSSASSPGVQSDTDISPPSHLRRRPSHARLHRPLSPLTPYFAPLPSPPPSPRNFSLPLPPLRRGLTMTPFRRPSPAPSSPRRPAFHVLGGEHSKSSPSILRHTSGEEGALVGEAEAGTESGLRRRRTDVRPAPVYENALLETCDAPVFVGRRKRRLTVTNPDTHIPLLASASAPSLTTCADAGGS